jgi:hypothetical protein
MPPSVRTELIDVAHATPRTLAAWRDLGARAAEPNPWFEPELLLPLRRHLIPGLMLVVAERAGEMVGCMPLKPNPGKGLLMFAAGWGVPHPLGTPLVDPSYLEPALRAMLHAVTNLTPQLRMSWRGIGADGPVMPILREVLAAAAPRRLRRTDGTWPILLRRSAPTDGGGSADHLGRDLEASRRLLGETLGYPLVIRDRSGEGTAADRFLAVEASSEKGRLGTATVQHPGAAEYFRDVCQGFGALGRLRLLALEAGTATIAMKCEMSAGKGLFELKTAEDEQFRQYSPRALLEIDAGRMFHDGRHDWAVSTALEDESPLQWLWPDRRPWTDIYFWLAGPARAAWRVTTTLARHLVGKGSG